MFRLGLWPKPGCGGQDAFSIKMVVHFLQDHIILFLCLANIVFGQIRYSVPEEMKKGSFVGNIAQDLGIDPKRMKSGSARIVSSDSSEYIELNLDKGILVVRERIDREQLCGQTTPCSVSFEMVMSNPMQLHSVVVEILDVNDNAPLFTENEIQLEISESAPLGSRILQESATDPDVGENGLQSYILTPTTHFNIKTQTSPDGGKYVEIILHAALDREEEDSLLLTLTAVDGGEPERSGTVRIKILVLDTNDNVPVFTQSIYKAEVRENTPRGTLVTTVSAADADEGLYGHVRYHFARVSAEIAELFSIDESNGEITVTGLIDYEKSKQYELNIQAKDQGGLMDSTKVVIEVTDVNDNTPVLALTSFSSPISEHSVSGTTVAIVNVKDADSGGNGQVDCSINSNVPFTLKSNLKNYYTLLTEGVLDRERNGEYHITFTAVDNGTPPLSSNKTITIKIADVNDNAPIFEQSFYAAEIMENNAPRLSVFSIQAHDADCNQNARISYFLLDSEVDGVPVSSYISVNSENGVIYALRSFDYEHIKGFQFRVKAQDGGSPPLSGNATVKIFIQDQNDNAPQILYPIQTAVSAEIVPPSAGVGFIVTKVVAVDVDSGQNAWLSYKLLKATDRALFAVGRQNGEIRTLRQVTDKDAVKQILTIVVEDNGQPTLSAIVNVNVALAESFPEVMSEFTDLKHDKNYNESLTFYLVLALAVVSFLFISSLVAIISVKIHRWRQSRFFYQSSLPVIPYYPPHYADAGGAGTLQHVYNYEVYRTNDSRKSDCKFTSPCNESVLTVDPSTTETMQFAHKETNNLQEHDSPLQVRM